MIVTVYLYICMFAFVVFHMFSCSLLLVRVAAVFAESLISNLALHGLICSITTPFDVHTLAEYCRIHTY